MFCNYCGAKNPEDAIFCSKCGKRQFAVSSDESAVDVAILPAPPLLEAPIANNPLASSNVPIVQGTPAIPNSPPGQNLPQSAANAASSVTPTAPQAGGTPAELSNLLAGQNIAPHFPSSGSSPAWNPQAGSQAPQTPVPSSQPTPHLPPDSQMSHPTAPPPHAVQHPSIPWEHQPQPASHQQMPPQYQHMEQRTPIPQQPHLGTGEVVARGARVAGSLSRRAVLAGLLGGAGIVAAGGGIALLVRSRSQQTSLPSPPTRGSSAGLSQTSTPSLVQLTVYIASSDGYTYALNASNGSLRWKSQQAGGFGGVSANGVLYTDAVAALRASDGQLLWSYHTAGQIAINSFPAVLDGYVYTSGGGDGLVHALRASDGSSIWSFQVDSGPFSSPAAANGVVYVSTAGGRVYALRVGDGSPLWQYQTGGWIESAPTLVDGVLYVGSEDRSVYALRASDGSLLWSYQTGTGQFGVGGSPRVRNGTVFFVANDGYAYALQTSDGTLIWRYQMGDGSNDSVALYNGVVYCPSNDHYIYALRASDGMLLWRYQPGGGISTSPAAVDGVLYVGSEDHSVYALRASDGSPLWHYQTGGLIQWSSTIGA